MKVKGFCFLLWLSLTTSLFAATPVKIGTPFFDPPFATNDSHYILNGFDIDLMKKYVKNCNGSAALFPWKGLNYILPCRRERSITRSEISQLPPQDSSIIYSQSPI